MQTFAYQEPVEMSEALAKYAKECKLSKAHLIRAGLEQYLEDLEDIAAVKRARKISKGQPTYTLDEMRQRYGLE